MSSLQYSRTYGDPRHSSFWKTPVALTTTMRRTKRNATNDIPTKEQLMPPRKRMRIDNVQMAKQVGLHPSQVLEAWQEPNGFRWFRRVRSHSVMTAINTGINANVNTHNNTGINTGVNASVNTNNSAVTSALSTEKNSDLCQPTTSDKPFTATDNGMALGGMGIGATPPPISMTSGQPLEMSGNSDRCVLGELTRSDWKSRTFEDAPTVTKGNINTDKMECDSDDNIQPTESIMVQSPAQPQPKAGQQHHRRVPLMTDPRHQLRSRYAASAMTTLAPSVPSIPEEAPTHVVIKKKPADASDKPRRKRKTKKVTVKKKVIIQEVKRIPKQKRIVRKKKKAAKPKQIKVTHKFSALKIPPYPPTQLPPDLHIIGITANQTLTQFENKLLDASVDTIASVYGSIGSDSPFALITNAISEISSQYRTTMPQICDWFDIQIIEPISTNTSTVQSNITPRCFDSPDKTATVGVDGSQHLSKDGSQSDAESNAKIAAYQRNIDLISAFRQSIESEIDCNEAFWSNIDESNDTIPDFLSSQFTDILSLSDDINDDDNADNCDESALTQWHSTEMDTIVNRLRCQQSTQNKKIFAIKKEHADYALTLDRMESDIRSITRAQASVLRPNTLMSQLTTISNAARIQQSPTSRDLLLLRNFVESEKTSIQQCNERSRSGAMNVTIAATPNVRRNVLSPLLGSPLSPIPTLTNDDMPIDTDTQMNDV